MITAQRIIDATARHYRMAPNALLAHRHSPEFAHRRWLAWQLAADLTTMSMASIGRKIGNYDHTTVMHAIRRMDQMLSEDHELAAAHAKLTDVLQAGHDLTRLDERSDIGWGENALRTELIAARAALSAAQNDAEKARLVVEAAQAVARTADDLQRDTFTPAERSSRERHQRAITTLQTLFERT